MTEPTLEQIDSEMAVAHDSLREAQTLMMNGGFRGAVSRAYYAVFHAARAVLWSLGVEAKTHKGVIRMFGERVVETGDVSAEFSDILIKAHDQRELADYHAMTGGFDKAEVEVLVADARRFVEKVEEILK